MGYTKQLGPTRSLLLALPASMVATLDEAAAALNLCRSDVIRRSLARDLQYVMGIEVPQALRFRRDSADRYSEWLSAETFTLPQGHWG